MHEGELFEAVLPGNVVRANLLPNLDGQGVLRMERLSEGHRDYVDRNRNRLARCVFLKHLQYFFLNSRVRLNSVIIEWDDSSIMLSSGDAQETPSIPRHFRVASHRVFRDDSSQVGQEELCIVFSRKRCISVGWKIISCSRNMIRLSRMFLMPELHLKRLRKM